MKLTNKSLKQLVSNLYQNALDGEKDSVTELDIRYFQGQAIAYEKITMLMDGNKVELFETLQEILYKNFETIDSEDADPF
jgi:hypothetical protein